MIRSLDLFWRVGIALTTMLFFVFAAFPVESSSLCGGTPGIIVPQPGKFYHGVFPGDDNSIFPDTEEDGVTLTLVQSYESAVGRNVVWVYFSHNWYNGRQFPVGTASWIRDHGAIPFIRLMLRSSSEQGIAEPLFTLEAIVRGDFDADLAAWGNAASQFGTPIIVEWGTEMNGSWFSWNGVWNGGAVTGPKQFRDAYRHIASVICSAGASNTTWVFHVASEDYPQEIWNAFENYYPGADVVDWVGVSVYGNVDPTDPAWYYFRDDMDLVMPRLTALAPDKPAFVFEFGVTINHPTGNAAAWADAALTDLLNGRWPTIRGFSWWNERWQNDSNPAHDANLRIQDDAALAAVFTTHLATPSVLSSPIGVPTLPVSGQFILFIILGAFLQTINRKSRKGIN